MMHFQYSLLLYKDYITGQSSTYLCCMAALYSILPIHVFTVNRWKCILMLSGGLVRFLNTFHSACHCSHATVHGCRATEAIDWPLQNWVVVCSIPPLHGPPPGLPWPTSKRTLTSTHPSICPSYCTSLFTLLTVSEVLVMHAPHHSQHRVKYLSGPPWCTLWT